MSEVKYGFLYRHCHRVPRNSEIKSVIDKLHYLGTILS